MDSKRLISSVIVGLVVIVLILIQNVYLIGILLALIALLGMDEYLKAISKVCKPIKWIGYVSCAIVAIINVIPQVYLLKFVLFIIPVILLILFAQVIVTNMKTTFKDIAYTFFGIGYIPFFIMFLSLINGLDNGKILIGYILVSSWGTDVFAYLIGTKFGKHKFSKVSPKKSIEGCLGGAIGTILIALIYTFILNTYFSYDYSYIYIGLISAVLSFIGQLGDFSASSIKRYVDIKDYSNLLPGHGGMLDRIDSVLFIAPFAYMFFI